MELNFRHIHIQVWTGVAIMATAFPAWSVTHHEAAGHGAAPVGLPQLNPATYSSQIFWLVIAFLLLYFLMSKLALPKVSEVLESRESEINNNLNRAEKFQAEIEEVRASYEDALAKAHAEAAAAVKNIEQIIADKNAEKQRDFSETARRRLAQSEQNIEKTKQDVLKSIEDIAADITRDALKKVADISIKKDDALKAVKAGMKEAA